jgi:hypothetical protein
MSFYAGFFLGASALMLFTTWVVSDCQSHSASRVCSVSLELTSKGVLHFVPVDGP